MNHILIAPVVLPAVMGALIILWMRADLLLQRVFSIAGTAALLGVALYLNWMASSGEVYVYRLGNWAAPFGIVLMLDRLAALMLVLTGVLALVVQLYAIGSGWDRKGWHFHALWQFQLMGINGAFLTGDAFNLFVFFEILLIASYALLLQGAGAARVRRRPWAADPEGPPPTGGAITQPSLREVARSESLCGSEGGVVIGRHGRDGVHLGALARVQGRDHLAVAQVDSDVRAAVLDDQVARLRLVRGRTVDRDDAAARLGAEIGRPAPLLNLGGGFGIPYFAGDTPVDLALVGEKLAERFAALPETLADTHLCIELGRYLVGEAGVYLTRVVDRKVSNTRTVDPSDPTLLEPVA